jgi:hypothetical protein
VPGRSVVQRRIEGRINIVIIVGLLQKVVEGILSWKIKKEKKEH